MARVIGSTKTWTWWLLGLCCAALFGGAARAGEFLVKARYGARPRPRPMPAPKVDEKSVTADQKKRAGELVDKYLGGESGSVPGVEEKKQIAKLIKDLGNDAYTVREAASKGVLKFGTKALAQLKAALKSSDAEVVQRARAAITEISKGGGNATVTELRRVYSAAMVVIGERRKKWQTAAYTASLKAIAFESQKKAEDVKKQREAKTEAEARVKELDKLAALVRTVRVMELRRIVPRVGIAK